MADDIKRPRHEHPMQPVVRATDGVHRFQRNAIVEWLLERAGTGIKTDLNDIAREPFDVRDREQFAQLIGYSVCGFADLSYTRRKTRAAASAQSERLARFAAWAKRARSAAKGAR